MNKKVTSKEEIINSSIDLIFNNDFNIRMLSNKLDISIGAVYNYFPSKGDLIIEVTKTIFRNMFIYDETCLSNVKNYIVWIFECIEKGNEKYPDFFNEHYLLFIKDVNYAKKHMMNFFKGFKKQLSLVVDNDKNIKENCFTSDFSKEDFVDFIFNNIYALIIQKEYDPSFLLKVLERTIY